MAYALDYPVSCPELGADVAPNIARAWLIQQMALRYQKAVPDLSHAEANDAAIATWGTDWDADPNPRTLAAANEEVDNDLEYWGDD